MRALTIASSLAIEMLMRQIPAADVLAEGAAAHWRRIAPDYKPAHAQQQMLLHVHCHQRALFNVKDEVAALRATGGEVTLVEAGCCGMAGPFGFERQGFAVSQTLAERALLPAVRAADANTLIVTDGFSCREQIAQNTARRAVHLAEVLAGRV